MPYLCSHNNKPAEIAQLVEHDLAPAEIAQLVEHDLAKVGVASSSLVFRSKVARMVESVDTRDLKSLGQ